MAELPFHWDAFWMAWRLTRGKKHGAGAAHVWRALVMSLQARSIANRTCGRITDPTWWLLRIGKARMVKE